MKIALIGDLHGNMPALEAAERDIKKQGVDEIWCLGDMVGKGPSSADTLDWALANCQVVLMGNWDEAVLVDTKNSAQWYRQHLGQERLERIRALPLEHRLRFSGRDMRLVHGRPVVKAVVYSDSPREERERLFAPDDGYRPGIVGFADIHRPFFQRIACGLLFNTGSVGNSLAGNPMATYAVMEGCMGDASTEFSVKHIELPYDWEQAVRDTERASGLPKKEAFINEIRTGVYSR